MLDTTTKRRIDTARDILVGKVPDPKSQVEQITIALIYKFMDDMDARSEELGGKREFFSGEFSKYGWKKLMSKELGGFEVLNLYAEAIQQMNLNPNIPQLFRDIFKNAFLPYRDPETLKSFLKVIDDFEYDHSERLGDAFEYLLSVLGSQGDAGQFRTPRHIIDFMVEVIDPKKEDTILDPACGTAGFLISSYKHIIKHNSSNYNPETDKDAHEIEGVDLAELTANGGIHYNGDKLTPDDRTRLSRNIVGYDISPDMVRLSLVNLYLHQLNKPQIFEYDTLTSEDNWNEYADVILANPPFMSPKGGIKPHKRFTISSKRSEVLFVDYIAEHLTTNGKAAIIVPEGIIFQSGTAYKQLRKMLVENYLFAVVSLPAGVFNPYSGVKTSILLMDKALSKKTDNILFIKIENDGFELGAQRRAKTGSQLPQAVKIIKDYINLCHSNETPHSNEDCHSDSDSSGEESLPEASLKNNSHSVLVSESLKQKHGETSLWNIATKAQIAENGEFNLGGERYISNITIKGIFDLIELETVADIQKGTSITSRDLIEGNIPVIAGGKQPAYFHKISNRKANVITVSASGAYAGFVNYFDLPIFASDCSTIISRDENRILTKFIYYLLKGIQEKIYSLQLGMGQPHVYSKDLKKIQIPLPPLEIQKEIVEEIDGYQKIIDGARQVVENYKPHIDIDPSWEMVELGEVANFEYGINSSAQDSGEARFIRITDIGENGKIRNDDIKFLDITEDSKKYLLNYGDLLVARIGATYGKTLIYEENIEAIFAGYLIRITFPQKNILNKFFWIFAQGTNYEHQKKSLVQGGGQPQFNANTIKKLNIPLPSLIEQEEIINQYEDENSIIESNYKLINIFVQKIKDRIAKVWGE